MNVFSVVERLTGTKAGPIQFDGERCLRSGDRLSACSACRDLCPASAIQWNAAAGKPPALLEETCTACRACLPACPVSAFSAADDAVAELLACAARAPSSSFDLLCEHHPRPATGPARGMLGLRVRGCLAGLGVGAYLALAAQGAERMVVRAESCGACPWAALQPRVTQQVAQAQHLLAATGRAAALTAQTEPLAAPVERPVQNTQSPPLSRRDVWRQLARQGRTAVAQAWPVTEKAGTPAARKPGLDRRRVNQAMGRMGDLSPRPPSLNGKGEQDGERPAIGGAVDLSPRPPSLNGKGEQDGVRPAISGAADLSPQPPSLNGKGEQDGERPAIGGAVDLSPRPPSLNGKGEQDGVRPAISGAADLSPQPPSLNGKGEQENLPTSLNGTVEQDSLPTSLNGTTEQASLRPSLNGTVEHDILPPSLEERGAGGDRSEGALGPGWMSLTASAACSACGVCARACRTGALRLDRDAASHYALRFIPRSCVGCDACLHVCLPGALTADHAPAIDLVYGPAAVFTLAAGELVQCERCH